MQECELQWIFVAQNLERKFPGFKEILENANMLCHDMQPNALLIWRGFINAKKLVLQTYPP
jgi:hypothetical protein